MTAEQKQLFEYWLTDNLKLTNMNHVELIIKHVDHYFCPAAEPAAALPPDNKVNAAILEETKNIIANKYKALEAPEINDLFRSLYAICERKGVDTNWEVITARIKSVLYLAAALPVQGTKEIIHKGIEFAKTVKSDSESYKTGAGFGYSCGYQAAIKESIAGYNAASLPDAVLNTWHTVTENTLPAHDQHVIYENNMGITSGHYYSDQKDNWLKFVKRWMVYSGLPV